MRNSLLTIIFAEIPIGGLGSCSKYNNVRIPPAAVHMIEHLFFGVNEKIYEMFTQNGITISAKTEMFRTRFTMMTSGSPERAKQLFLNRLSNFTIEEGKLKKEKAIVLLEAESEKKLMSLFGAKKKELICKHYDANKNTTVMGTREEINRLECDVLQNLRQLFYSPKEIKFYYYKEFSIDANDLFSSDFKSNGFFCYDVCHPGEKTSLVSFLYSPYAVNYSEWKKNYLFLLCMEQHVVLTIDRHIRGIQLSQTVDFFGNDMLYNVIIGTSTGEGTSVVDKISSVERVNEAYFMEIKQEAKRYLLERIYTMNSRLEACYEMARIGLDENRILAELKEYTRDCFLVSFMQLAHKLKNIKN